MVTTAIERDMWMGRRWDDRTSSVAESPPGGRSAVERVARGLGWFSIGLGVAEATMPSRMARMIGIEDNDAHRRILLTTGLREIATGVAILAGTRTAGAVWARVGGDMLDLAFLRQARGSSERERGRAAAATAAVLGVTALDAITGQQLSRERGPAVRGIKVNETITIAKPPAQVYEFWRDFRNLPRFMDHLESVEVIDDTRSRWRARAPAGGSVAWDAEIVDDRPHERISWRSVEDADVQNAGSVSFRPAPGGRGTEIHVDFRYDPPAGKLGAAVATLFGEEPGHSVKSDLRRLKQVLETGDVVRSDASIHSGMHSAQPSGNAKSRGATR